MSRLGRTETRQLHCADGRGIQRRLAAAAQQPDVTGFAGRIEHDEQLGGQSGRTLRRRRPQAREEILGHVRSRRVETRGCRREHAWRHPAVADHLRALRLLRPGGLCVHQDVPLRFQGLSEFRKFELSWDTLHNNEPYWEVYANADLAPELLAAGFAADCIHVGSLPAREGTLPWFVACAWRSA